MIGALQAVKGNARRLGGSFAMWGGFFSVFDCSFAAIRGREDPFNSIASGFCTGAVLAIRGGAQAAFVSGAFGGVILAVIEGLNLAMTKYFAKLPAPEPVQIDAVVDPADQPWYIKWMMPAQPVQQEVDFSDPKELAAAPGARQAASPLEPQISRQRMWATAMNVVSGGAPWDLVRAHQIARGEREASRRA